MNKSRVTEYILAYMQEKGISASEISEQTQVPEEKLHPDYKEPLLAEEFRALCFFTVISGSDCKNDKKIMKKRIRKTSLIHTKRKRKCGYEYAEGKTEPLFYRGSFYYQHGKYCWKKGGRRTSGRSF